LTVPAHRVSPAGAKFGLFSTDEVATV